MGGQHTAHTKSFKLNLLAAYPVADSGFLPCFQPAAVAGRDAIFAKTTGTRSNDRFDHGEAADDWLMSIIVLKRLIG